MAAIDRHQPPGRAPLRPGAARAGADRSPPRRRIDGGENHQPGIVDDAVGIFERGAERPLQRIADRMMGDVDGGGCRQARARGQPVVKQQPGPQLPGRTFVGMGGDRKAHRAHQMRRDLKPDVALGQRRADTKKRRRSSPARSPWISRGEAEEAPAPRSPCSSRITRRPRPAASRAMLTPFNPPPIIARS